MPTLLHRVAWQKRRSCLYAVISIKMDTTTRKSKIISLGSQFHFDSLKRREVKAHFPLCLCYFLSK